MPAPSLTPTRQRFIKPSGDVQLDRTHPLSYGLLSCFLLNEGSGTIVRDLAKPSRTSTLAAGASWTKTPYGSAVVPSSTAAQKNSFSDNPTSSGIPFTVSILLKHTGSDLNFAGLITDATTWGCYIHGNKFDLDGGADPDSTTSLTTGSFYHAVWYWDGTNAAYAVNGLRDSGGGANTGITNPAVFTGWGGDGVNPAQNNTIIAFWVWDRLLSDVESGAHYADPFAMIRTPSDEARSFAVTGSRIFAPVMTPPALLVTPAKPAPALVQLFSPPPSGGGGGGALIANAALVITGAVVVNPSAAVIVTAALVESAAQVVSPSSSIIVTAALVESGAIVINPSSPVVANAALVETAARLISPSAPVVANAVLAESAQVVSPSGDALIANAVTGGATQQVVNPSAPLVVTALLVVTGGLAGSGGGSIIVNAALVETSAQILATAAVAVSSAVIESGALLIARGLTVQTNAALSITGTVLGQVFPGHVLLADSAVHAALLADVALHTATLSDSAVHTASIADQPVLATCVIADSAIHTVTITDSAP